MHGELNTGGTHVTHSKYLSKDHFHNPRLRLFLIIAASIATALTLWPSIFNVRAIESFIFFFHIDADVYREGALAFLRGENLYTQDYQVGGIQLPFTYPPLAAAIFVPLGIIPSNFAGALLTVISAVLLWWCVAIVARRMFKTLNDADSRLIAFLLLPVALSCEPVFQTIQFGQVNIILMTLVFMDTFSKKPWLPRGFWIGLAASIKLTPAVFGLYFLIKKDWKSAGVSIASGVGFSLLAFAIAPASSKIYWTETLSDPSRIGNLSYIANQSVRGFFSRLMHENQDLVEMIWMGAVVLAVVGVAIAMWRAVQAGNIHAAVLLNSLIALLCSPVSWSHHWVWLIPIAIGLAASAWNQRSTAPGISATAAVLAILTVLPMFISTFWNMPYDSEASPAWPLILQPSGNAYVVVAIAVVIVAIVQPGIFGHATASSSRRINPVLTIVMGITAAYLLANVWFKGNDRNEALYQYPIQTLDGRGLTELGTWLTTPLRNSDAGIALAVIGVINVAALVWIIYFLLHRFLNLKADGFAIAVAMVFALATFPVQDALQFGSLTLLSAALIITDFFSKQEIAKRGLLTGIAAGISGWPILILIGLLIHRRYKAALIAAGTAAFLWLLGLVLNPQAFNLNLLRLWFSTRDGDDNLSFFGFLSRWIYHSPAAAIIWMILGLAIGTWSIHRTFKAGNIELSGTLSIALPLLVLPTVELHYWVLLFPLLITLWNAGFKALTYLGIFLSAVSWTPAHLSYGSIFPLNDPAPEGFVAHFGWYLLVEPMAVAPAALILAIYLCTAFSPTMKKDTEAKMVSA